MTVGLSLILGSFTAPVHIGTNPWYMLWMLPLAAAIAVIYKVTKLPKISAWHFLREVALLFGSIVVFVVVAGVVLLLVTHLATT